MPNEPGLRLYRISEAAQLLKISRRTVQHMLAEGTLKAVRFGRAVRIPAEELHRVVRAHLS